MAEDLVVGAVYDTWVRTTQATQWGINKRYNQVFSIVGIATPTTDDLAAAEDARLGPLYKALLTAAATYDFVSCRRVSGVAPFKLSSLNGVNGGAGTVAGDPLPKQTAGVISLYANSIGKKYRGRSFIPFPGEADSGALAGPTAGYITRLASLAVAYRQQWSFTLGVTLITMDPVIWPGDPLFPTQPISVAIAQAKWATQRRRGAYGKPNVP